MFKVLSALVFTVSSRIISFDDVGGIQDDYSNHTQWFNGGLLNTTLNILESGDVFVVPNKTYSVMGGINVKNLKNVTI
tara:strand:+ start:63 stop:296 length:234 start_codon:yes stop_codon:yes gene_type:complete